MLMERSYLALEIIIKGPHYVLATATYSGYKSIIECSTHCQRTGTPAA